MVPTTMGAGDLVRVTVASGTRRVDLALPGAVPVTELLPELARSVGLLDAASVHGGYRLVTAQGRELAGDAGLVGQGVVDGGWLTVTAGVADRPREVHDDAAEAMAGLVERDLAPWRPGAARRTALGAAGLLWALGAAALVSQRDPSLAGPAAATAGVLLCGAIALSRSRRDPAAVLVAWVGALYAAVAGSMAMVGDSPLGRSAHAGAAAAGAGVACLLGLRVGRPLALPPLVAGVVFLADGLLREVRAVSPAVVPMAALVLGVIAGGAFPRLALGATHAGRDPCDEARPVDVDRLAADARTAHEILLGMSASVGLLLVLTAPLAVSRGAWGAVLAVACCAVVSLRARHHRAGSQVLAGAVSGTLGLAATAVAALWLAPDWRPAVVALLVAGGAAALAAAVLPAASSMRLGRLGDLAESTATLALLPLLLVAAGVLSAIRR